MQVLEQFFEKMNLDFTKLLVFPDMLQTVFKPERIVSHDFLLIWLIKVRSSAKKKWERAIPFVERVIGSHILIST